MKRLALPLIIVVIALVSVWFWVDEGRTSNPFYGDSQGYYLYLPSTFIYHNLKDVTHYPNGKELPKGVTNYAMTMEEEAVRGKDSMILIQYTYGVALLEAPFFFIAHAYTLAAGGNANGYSSAYSNALKYSSIFYALITLLLVYRILRFYYNAVHSILGIAFIFLGTNLFWFGLHQSGMSHVPLAFLYALLIYLSILVQRMPKLLYFLLIAFTAGLITIIRPTDIVCLGIPLLYNVYSKESLRSKLVFIRTHLSKVLLSAPVFLMPVIPQMVYWEMMTGHYLFYSYGSQSFNWTHPKIIEGLFYGANGWLVYSPIMIFSILGLLLYRYYREWIITILVVLPLYIYMVYSWYCYNYINGLGSRPMIHLYPLLALPLVAIIKYVAKEGRIIQSAFALCCMFLISVNISYSKQQAVGILNSEESNVIYNWAILYRTKLSYNDLVVRDVQVLQPDIHKLTIVTVLGSRTFDDSTSDKMARDTTAGHAGYVLHMKDQEFPMEGIKVLYDKKRFGGARWLRASGRFMCPENPGYYKPLMIVTVWHDGQTADWHGCKVSNKIGLADSSCIHAKTGTVLEHFEKGLWGQVYFFVKLPASIKDGDTIDLNVWNLGKREMYMDDMTLELYK